MVETTTGPFGEEAWERTEWSEIDEAELLSPTAGGVLWRSLGVIGEDMNPWARIESITSISPRGSLTPKPALAAGNRPARMALV